MSREKKRTRKVKGVVDPKTGAFLPYPLPFSFPIVDDSYARPVEMALERDDPWFGDDDSCEPLIVEFRCTLALPLEYGNYLLRRAEQLDVDVEDLPERVTLEPTEEEDDAIREAQLAIGYAIDHAILRWAHLREVDHPDGLRVPKFVEVGENDDSCWRGRALVGHVVWEGLALRERARKFLNDAELQAFNAYCDCWDAVHGWSLPQE